MSPHFVNEYTTIKRIFRYYFIKNGNVNDMMVVA